MSDKLDKVLQIRLSSREQEMIKRAFVGTNVSYNSRRNNKRAIREF